jgi:hypothetical protein
MRYLLVAISIGLIYCNNNRVPANNTVSPNTQDTLSVLQDASGQAINLINDLETIDTLNDYILFPLEVQNAKAESESLLGYSKGRGEGRMFWNIVFYNYKTKALKLLEPDKKILLGGYQLDDYKSYWRKFNNVAAGSVETNKFTPYIFYTVYADDFNEDKKLTTDDPAYIYISKEDGSNFIRISPANVHITQKSYPKNNGNLLLKGLKDSNGDKQLNSNDEIVFYEVNMQDSLPTPREIMNTNFKLELKKLFDKNWKTK